MNYLINWCLSTEPLRLLLPHVIDFCGFARDKKRVARQALNRVMSASRHPTSIYGNLPLRNNVNWRKYFEFKPDRLNPMDLNNCPGKAAHHNFNFALKNENI
jgi:hypothetical protein